MSRYIDADLLIQKWIFRGKSQAMYRDEIRSVPTADVVEVVHGKWIYDGVATRCSNCGDVEEFEDCQRWDSNYCPNCGAKMDLQ